METEICDLCGSDTNKSVRVVDTIYNQDDETIEYVLCDACSDRFVEGYSIEDIQRRRELSNNNG